MSATSIGGGTTLNETALKVLKLAMFVIVAGVIIVGATIYLGPHLAFG